MNETLNNLLTRRSCRAYEAAQIRDEELNAILEAGTFAPTGMGRQSPLILSIQDPEAVQKLERLNALSAGNPEAHTFLRRTHRCCGVCPQRQSPAPG